MTRRISFPVRWLLLMGGLVMLLNSIELRAAQFDAGPVSGSFSSHFSYGASWRLEDPDKDLVSPGNASYGRASSSVVDDGTLNFKQDELISSIFKGRHELELNYQNYGLFTRVRYWYDYELAEGNREHGNSLNAYQPDEKLDDSHFSDYAKSKGLELLDLYVYAGFDLGDIPIDVRLGRQVVSWGESTFIQNGVNVLNPVDVSALRKPGSELKDALLPVGMLYVNAGLTPNLSMELVYQYEWESWALDGCGNFFATNDLIAEGCNILTAINMPSDRELMTEPQSLSGFTIDEAFLRRSKDLKPKDDGQYGIAFRYFAESLNSTEFGFYYVNYHSRIPIFSGRTATEPYSVAPLLGGKPTYMAEFPEDIEVFALTFATTVGRWAVSGELSHRPNMPLQISTTEVVHALALTEFLAPWSYPLARTEGLDPGGVVHGYDDYEFNQLQFTFINFFDQVLGASRLTVAAEIGINHIPDLPDTDEARYGRSPAYGVGDFGVIDRGASQITCQNSGLFPANPNLNNCTDDGFITEFAWGYRVRAGLDYSNVFWGVNLTPNIAFSHDVKGTSPPPNFNDGTKAFGIGLNWDYLHRYSGGISYTSFFDGDYSELRDRDFASVSFAINY